jgi:hypothetical protein
MAPMSRLHTANGKRISSMAHAKHPTYCSCGRLTHGNGARAAHQAMHDRADDGHRRVTQRTFNALFPDWWRLDEPKRTGRKVEGPRP